MALPQAAYSSPRTLTPGAIRNVAPQEQQHEEALELILDGRWLFDWRRIRRRAVVGRRFLVRRQVQCESRCQFRPRAEHHEGGARSDLRRPGELPLCISLCNNVWLGEILRAKPSSTGRIEKSERIEQVDALRLECEEHSRRMRARQRACNPIGWHGEIDSCGGRCARGSQLAAGTGGSRLNLCRIRNASPGNGCLRRSSACSTKRLSFVHGLRVRFMPHYQSSSNS
jgi:hypothetical protein